MPESNEPDVKRLARLFRADQPLIFIPTHEEADALEMVRASAIEDGRTMYAWTCVRGVSMDLLSDSTMEPGTETPIAGIARMTQFARAAARGDSAGREIRGPVLVFADLIDHLKEDRVLRVFRESLAMCERARAPVVLVDHQTSAPRAVESSATRFEMTLPDEKEIHRIVRATLRDANCVTPISIAIQRSELDVIVANLRGLSRRQIAQIIRQVICEDKAFTGDDAPHILTAKRRALAADGLLEAVEAPLSLDHIGGMGRLKAWLIKRQNALSAKAKEFGLNPPRGVLLLGVQGAGKSLCAKAIATAWKRPLLRMNVGALYDKYVGESEKRLREALHQAEAMAPVVLWIDEVEKAFASAGSNSNDGGLSKRMFGELLTWMQEHDAPVFTVATANDIDALPPELLRKGRFDEIFFVDLPGAEARKAIFEIHLKKRGRGPADFDLEALVKASTGYSGAEIEQAIISGLHEAFASDSALSTEMLLEALEESPPLSVTMREKIEWLREWARERCVPAE